MANVNIRTPRFYCDLIQYRLSRGIAQNGNFDVLAESGTITGISSGSEADLFDGRPLNLVTFNTTDNGGADHVLINIDTLGVAKNSFVAILNHNMATADAKFRVYASDTESHIQAVNFASATPTVMTSVVNATSESDAVVVPDVDGSTIVTFAEHDLRYLGIQIEGNNSNIFDNSTALTIGCVMVGEYYDMVQAPELEVKRSIEFDGKKTQQSLGGQRYTNFTNYGKLASSTSKSPFVRTSDATQVYGGRMSYDMSFSYLNSTDIMPDNYAQNIHTDDNVIEDIWAKTNGGGLPMIATMDGTSTAESDYLYCRFNQNSLDMTQVAPDVFSLNLKLIEEF